VTAASSEIMAKNHMPLTSPAIFDDLRVLELTGIIGQQCGKLFADMGADVVRIEPPGGAEARRVGPFLDDLPHADRSLSFWHYNTNKRSITLDLGSAGGRSILGELVRSADVLIEDAPPGRMSALGLAYENLTALKPDLIMLSITPFGQTGPYRDFLSSDLISLALGGPLWSCGYDDHSLPPVRPYTDAAYQIASHYAFVGALAALVQRQADGGGQYIDVSMHEACHDTTEGAMPNYYFGGLRVLRQTGRHAAAMQTQQVIFPCADGKEVFTRVPTEPGVWKRLVDWLDEAGLACDLQEERFSDPSYRQEQMSHIIDIVAAFSAANSAEDLFAGAQERGLVWAAVRSPDEVVHDVHLKARGFFERVEHPELGRSFKYPGAPYRFQETPWSLRRRAPLLGEHNEEVYCRGLGFSRSELSALREAAVI